MSLGVLHGVGVLRWGWGATLGCCAWVRVGTPNTPCHLFFRRISSTGSSSYIKLWLTPHTRDDDEICGSSCAAMSLPRGGGASDRARECGCMLQQPAAHTCCGSDAWIGVLLRWWCGRGEGAAGCSHRRHERRRRRAQKGRPGRVRAT